MFVADSASGVATAFVGVVDKVDLVSVAFSLVVFVSAIVFVFVVVVVVGVVFVVVDVDSVSGRRDLPMRFSLASKFSVKTVVRFCGFGSPNRRGSNSASHRPTFLSEQMKRKGISFRIHVLLPRSSRQQSPPLPPRALEGIRRALENRR